MTTETCDKNVSRRLFLKIAGCGAFFITIGISLIGSIRFLFPRVLFEKPSSFMIGFQDELRGEMNGQFHVLERWKEEHAVWIVRDSNRLYAINARCTHLGCTPNYFADDGIFRCPCHGSQFHSNGINFAGPAPRPLDRLHISYSKGGQIVIDKSRVYTSREFNKEGAYVEV